MIDVEECINEFLKTKEINKEPVNRTRENMIVFTYNNGNGVMVLDRDKFNKLSKSRQNKLFKLCK